MFVQTSAGILNDSAASKVWLGHLLNNSIRWYSEGHPIPQA